MAFASGQVLTAQTQSPLAAAPAKPVEEETIVLSPFEVSSSKNTGYQATDTLAGTRIRTDLKDVGSAISVITKEFMQDIGATDTGTLLQFTPNAEVAGTRGTFAGLGNGTTVDETNSLRAPGTNNNRVRGLATADNTRDFFGTDIPWDSFNVERVDIQRGPNSILFGLGSPAGIVNASINGAGFRSRGEAQYRFGSYGSQRASLDVNQVLIKNVLSIRVDGLYNRERFQQDPAFQNDKRVYGAIRFDPQLFKDPSFHTSFKVKYENGDIKANRPRVVPPLDSITPWFRPVSTDPNSLTGGMGKLVAVNGYQVGSAATATFSPWSGGVTNQQQPLWFIDGGSANLYRIYGGFVNTGALSATGTPQGAGTNLTGLRYADVFTALGWT